MMLKRFTALLLALSLLFALPLDAVAQLPGENIADLFNSVELSPESPRSVDLDAYLDSLMAEIFLRPETGVSGVPAELTAYEKLLACYDYIIASVSYGNHIPYMNAAVGNTTAREIYRAYGEVEGYGAATLASRVGMCNTYAAAFILMAREIGFNAYLVKGSTRAARGGYTYHEWAEILIDGQVYVFDPQLDQSLARQGLGSYIIFGKPYSELTGRYLLISKPA